MPIYPLPQTPPLQRKARSRRLGPVGIPNTDLPGVTATLVFAAPSGGFSTTGGTVGLPEIVLRTRVAC